MKFILIRVFFLVLVVFAFLNSVKILRIPLHFPWLIIFLISLAIWLFWEQIYRRIFSFPSVMGAFLLFQLYVDTVGNIFDFYTKFNWFDKITHFTGGMATGAFAIFFLSYFDNKNHWKLSLRTLIIFAVTLTLSLAVIYEFWEYFEYSILNYKLIIIGVTDTTDDLLFDFLGAVTSILLLTYLLKKNYFSPIVADSKIK